MDCGTDSSEAVDYPDFAVAVARKVASGECEVGIVVDGAGIGSAMAANKVSGVRAALCYDYLLGPQQPGTQSRQRTHPRSRVDWRGPRLADRRGLACHPWGEGRHAHRVAKIDALDRGRLEEPA